jgi:hypothetical protein
MRRVSALLCIALLFLMGCFAANVETGLPPSNKVIKQSFAACWIYGLVPPSTVDAAAECPNGVARVETQLSFVNRLVAILTLGIYTPMQIEVTCAERSNVGFLGWQIDIVVPEGASTEEIQNAFAEAARQAAESRRAVFVQL